MLPSEEMGEGHKGTLVFLQLLWVWYCFKIVSLKCTLWNLLWNKVFLGFLLYFNSIFISHLQVINNQGSIPPSLWCKKRNQHFLISVFFSFPSKYTYEKVPHFYILLYFSETPFYFMGLFRDNVMKVNEGIISSSCFPNE